MYQDIYIGQLVLFLLRLAWNKGYSYNAYYWKIEFLTETWQAQILQKSKFFVLS